MRSSAHKNYFEQLRDSFLNKKWLAFFVLALVVVTGILGFGEQLIRVYGSLVRPTPKLEDTLSDAKIRPIYFPFMTAKLTKQSKKQLDSYASYLLNEDVKKILIEGHTREVNPFYNIPLALRRVRAVQKYLETAIGVSHDKIEIIPYGAERPLKKEPSGYNDRVELRLIKKKGIGVSP